MGYDSQLERNKMLNNRQWRVRQTVVDDQQWCMTMGYDSYLEMNTMVNDRQWGMTGNGGW